MTSAGTSSRSVTTTTIVPRLPGPAVLPRRPPRLARGSAPRTTTRIGWPGLAPGLECSPMVTGRVPDRAGPQRRVARRPLLDDVEGAVLLHPADVAAGGRPDVVEQGELAAPASGYPGP